MAYSNDKLIPGGGLFLYVAPIIFDNIRSTSEHTSKRKRQCYRCMGNIKRGERYISHQFRYDRKIITISFHKNCFNNE